MSGLPYELPTVLPGSVLSTLPEDATGGADGSLALIAGGHCADAFRLLISQYQDSPHVRALVCSEIHPADDLDAAIVGLFHTLLSIENAVGAGLDLIGAIVREKRDGRGDYLYRAALRVRVLINRSQGRPEDLIAIARLFEGDTVDTVRLTEHQPARMVIRVIGTPTNPPQEVNKRLRAAKAGGVALQVAVQAYPAVTGRGFRLSRAADAPEKNTTEGLSSAVDGGGGYLLHAMG